MGRIVKKSYQILRARLLASYRFALWSPRTTLLIFALIAAVAIFALPKVKTLLAMEDVVENTSPSKQYLDDLLATFKVRNTMLLSLKNSNGGWTSDELCTINHWLSHQKFSNEEIASTMAPFDVRKTRVVDTVVLYDRILDLPCLNDRMIQGPSSEAIAQFLKEIGQTPWGFGIVGRNADDFFIQLELTESRHDERYGSFSPRVVEMIQKDFADKVLKTHPQILVSWLGTADFQHHLYVGLKRVNILNILLLLLIILIMRMVFGRWRAGVIFSGTLIFGGMIVYGAMSWSQIPVDILSKSLFLMIAVAGVEDFVYLICRSIELKGRWRRAWREILVPGFLTSLTTTLGFWSLCASDLQIIRRFGFWAGVGSLVEWAIVFLVLPAFFQLYPGLVRLHSEQKTKAFGWFQNLKFAQVPRRFSYVLLFLLVLFPVAFKNLNISDVPLAMFSKNHPLKSAFEDLRQRNGGEVQASLVFPNRLPADERNQVLQQVKALPGVVHTMGAHDFVEFLLKTLPTENGYREMVQRQLEGAPFLESWISNTGKSRYNLYLVSAETKYMEETRKKIDKLCEWHGCYLTGTSVLYSEFAREIPMTLLDSFSLSLVLVGLVLGWLTWVKGELKNLHWVLLSSFWGPCFMFLIIAALQIKINFLICIFASVLVGLTGDNAIQFLCGSRKSKELKKGMLDNGGAALISGFLMGLSSLIFLGSYFVPPRVFGVLLLCGFVASTFGDYWILKALVRGGKKND